MAKIILPAILQPISRRKDKSVVIKMETRELNPSEILSLMSMEGEEGWLLFASNELQEEDIPKESADLETKSHAQRLRSILFLLFKQASDKGEYVGSYETYYKDNMERIISRLKEKIDEA